MAPRRPETDSPAVVARILVVDIPAVGSFAVAHILVAVDRAVAVARTPVAAAHILVVDIPVANNLAAVDKAAAIARTPAALLPAAKVLPRALSRDLPQGAARHTLRRTYPYWSFRSYTPIPPAGQVKERVLQDAGCHRLRKTYPYWSFRRYRSTYPQRCYCIQPFSFPPVTCW